MMIPKALLNVIFSLTIMADKISVQIGVIETSTALLIGVESSSPLKKANMFIDMPKTVAKSNLGQSFFSIFSLGRNRETPQKSTAAPAVRRKINPKGLTKSGITPFANV